MARTMPPTLNASRNSSLLASTPCVRIAGTAGPLVAAVMLTGVPGRGAGSSTSAQPLVTSIAAMRPTPASLRMSRAPSNGIDRQLAARSCVLELGTACQHIEACRDEVELGARECAACVDELDVTRDAFVTLATGDAKRCTCRLSTRLGSGKRCTCRSQTVVRLLHLETNLLRDLFLLQDELTLGSTCLRNARCIGAAVEDPPSEHERRHPEVVAFAYPVLFTLRACLDA